MFDRVDGIEEEIRQCIDQLKRLKGVSICPNCQAEVPAGSQFCNNCGIKLPPDPMQSQTMDRKMQPPAQRQGGVGNGARFCIKCGAMLEEDQSIVVLR